MDITDIQVTVKQRPDGRFEGALFINTNNMVSLGQQDKPDQVVFSGYSYLVHLRNGEIDAPEVDLSDVARRVVLYYYQKNGTLTEMVDALNAAVAAAGIHATFEQNFRRSGWEADNQLEGDKARAFRHDLDEALRWADADFTKEVNAVAGVIQNYTQA